MLTFHKIIAGCEAGDEDAWRAFLADYTPFFQAISSVHLRGSTHFAEMWERTLSQLAQNDYAAARGFEHQSEREFLLDLRRFYLKSCRQALGEGGTPEEPARVPLTGSSVAAILKGAPLVHQEVLFLRLAGYSSETLEKIFRLTPAVAQSSLARLGPAGTRDVTPADGEGRASAWLNVLAELWSGKTEACPSTRLFIRIQEGQIGWQEKDPAEKHVSECMPCLERWTALREGAYLRWAAPPLAISEVEHWLPALGLKKEFSRPERKSLLSRVFGN